MRTLAWLFAIAGVLGCQVAPNGHDVAPRSESVPRGMLRPVVAPVVTNAVASSDATGDTCADPVALTPDEPLRDQVTPLTGTGSTQCRTPDAPQRFYSVAVPVHERVIVTVEPAEYGRAILRALDDCDARECLGDDESASPGAHVSLSIDSTQEAPATKIVTVSATTALDHLHYDITTHVEPLTLPGNVGRSDTIHRAPSL